LCARHTYLSSPVDEIVAIALWKKDLSAVSESAASALATPSENPDLFPDMEIALQVEKMFLGQRDSTKATGIPASDYFTAKDDLDLNLIELIKGRSQLQPPEGGETKTPDPADEGDADEDHAEAAQAEAQRAAEEDAMREEEERAAAEEEAVALLATEEAAARAAATAATDDEDIDAADETEAVPAAKAGDDDEFADDW
jgi:coatomer subunit beta'